MLLAPDFLEIRIDEAEKAYKEFICKIILVQWLQQNFCRKHYITFSAVNIIGTHYLLINYNTFIPNVLSIIYITYNL